MKKAYFIAAIALFLSFSPSLFAADRELAPLQMRKPGQPVLDRRQGWLTISNRDWVDYYLTIDADHARIMLDRQNNGGTRIASGSYQVVPLERAMWEVVGDSDRDMVEVRIRPGLESELALVPTGSGNQSGLVGVTMSDGSRNTGTLFGTGSSSDSPAAALSQPTTRLNPTSASARVARELERLALPALGLGLQNQYADPRSGASALPQFPSQRDSYRDELYNRQSRQPAPDVVGDALNELNSSSGLYPQTQVQTQNYRDELRNNNSRRAAPDVMGDVLNELDQSTVNSLSR